MRVSVWQKLFASLLTFIFTIGLVTNIANAKELDKKVVLVVIDRITIEDYKDLNLTNLQNLANKGSLGLLNNNTGAGIYSEHTYLTIGGGAHLAGKGDAYNGYNEFEEVQGVIAKDEFLRRTGINAPKGSVVQMSIGQLARTNEELPYEAIPGALGQAIQDAGMKTAIIGNADTMGNYRRLATSLTMNRQGLTDMGSVDHSILLTNQMVLGSYRTDYNKVLERFDEYSGKGASFIVIESGDVSRLYEEKDKGTDIAFANQRAQVLRDIDKFVGKLAERLDFNRDLLLVVTPTPPQEAVKENRSLTPIIVRGPSFQPNTLLTSGTTKRDGIVMNTDIAPTVLKFLGAETVNSMSGRPFMVSDFVPNDSSYDYLANLYNGLVVTYQARPPIQSAYVLIQLIVLIAALYGLFIKRQIGEIMKPFLLFVMSVPLAELILPLFPKTYIALMALELVVLALIITWLAVLSNKKFGLDPFVFICVASASTILGDILNNSYLQKQSLLGYDPIVGARFYGIGNEYMGVLIGSVIIGVTASIQYWRKWRKQLIAATAVIFLFTVYAMAAPNLGTNVGGTIAATAGLLVTFLLLIGVRFKPRTVLLVSVIVVAAVSSFIAFDLTRPSDLRSHMGTTAALILKEGPGQALEIAQRKWQMNMKLLRYTVWSRILLASLGALALLFYRPRGVMENIRVKYPYLFIGFIGVLTGALVAFAFNDSGVVAAATTMIFGAPPLVYLALTERRTK